VFHPGEREIFAHFPHGMGRSRLGGVLTGPPRGHTVTGRNWRSVTRLLELTEADRAVARKRGMGGGEHQHRDHGEQTAGGDRPRGAERPAGRRPYPSEAMPRPRAAVTVP
jgi:hypothetical protein